MRSLHFHLPFGMDHRACAPPIRFRLLPTLWTGDLLVPPISMLQQQLPQHLSHQLPPQHRQLACYLIKVRLPMLFPPLPHLLKHLLCASHKFRLRLFSFHFAPPLLFSVPTPSLTPFSLAKNLGCTPAIHWVCIFRKFSYNRNRSGADLTIRVGVYFPGGAADDGILPAVDRALSICVREAPAQTASKNHE